jgi:hypothetical protein
MSAGCCVALALALSGVVAWMGCVAFFLAAGNPAADQATASAGAPAGAQAGVAAGEKKVRIRWRYSGGGLGGGAIVIAQLDNVGSDALEKVEVKGECADPQMRSGFYVGDRLSPVWSEGTPSLLPGQTGMCILRGASVGCLRNLVVLAGPRGAKVEIPFETAVDPQ